MTPRTIPCLLCEQPTTHELLLRGARTGKHVCEDCLLTLGAAKHRAQDARVAATMADHKARVARLVEQGDDAAMGDEF